MADALAAKVVIKQTVLQGSDDSDYLQKIAVVYVNGKEYRVLAPPEAHGDALEWLDHMSVRQWAGVNSEVEIQNAVSILALKLVKEELLKMRRETVRAYGKHPDGIHHIAQICARGHVQTSRGERLDTKYCGKCGAVCTEECQQCHETIRGGEIRYPASYTRPEFFVTSADIHIRGCKIGSTLLGNCYTTMTN